MYYIILWSNKGKNENEAVSIGLGTSILPPNSEKNAILTLIPYFSLDYTKWQISKMKSLVYVV